MKIITTYIISGIFLLAESLCEKLQPTAYNLAEQMLRDYNPAFRPVYDEQTVTNVTVEYLLYNLLNVDESKQTVRLSIYRRMNWKDELLTWEPSDYDNITSVNLPSNLVWTPEIDIFNIAERSSAIFKHVFPSIRSDGTIELYTGCEFAVACALDLRDYPDDENVCILEHYVWNPRVNISSMWMEQPEWGLENPEFSISAESQVMYDPARSQQFTLEFKIKRRPAYFRRTIELPQNIIKIMGLLSHLLPPDSESKLDLLMNSILTSSIYMMMVTTQLPVTAELPNIITSSLISMIYLLFEVGMAALIKRICTIRDMPINDKVFRVCTFTGCVLLLPHPVNGLKCRKQLVENQIEKQEASTDNSEIINKLFNVIIEQLADWDKGEYINSQWIYVGALIDRVLLIAAIIFASSLARF